MAPSVSRFSALLNRLCVPVIPAALVALLANAESAMARSRYGSPEAAEDFAWARIKEGKAADFKDLCDSPALDPRANDEDSENKWHDDCRQLSARFLVNVITKKRLGDQVSFAGVRIIGARIVGDFDIQNAKLERAIFIAGSRIENVKLESVQTNSDFELIRSRVSGIFVAKQFHGELSLNLRGTEFQREVNLENAKVDVNLDMDDTVFDREVKADQMQVGSSFLMNNAKFKKELILPKVRVNGQVAAAKAEFGGRLDAQSLQVGTSAYMPSIASESEVNLVFASIGTNLDLRNAKLAHLNLSGATISGDLRLAVQSYRNLVWCTRGRGTRGLYLRNTRIGNLMDAEDVWPEKGDLHLDGFALSRFGGFGENEDSGAFKRGVKWWDDWARRDPNYSPSPYQQLAAAFAASGHVEMADQLRYARYEREQENLGFMAWIWSWPLKWIAGFGIYPHRVLYWIAVISLGGAAYLWAYSKGVRDAGHGVIWCFGASLSKLLPVIDINKEFKDFFDDPTREKLTEFQTFVFSLIGLLGWFLAAILVAAVSGITGKS